jgi:hypothetical protein
MDIEELLFVSDGFMYPACDDGLTVHLAAQLHASHTPNPGAVKPVDSNEKPRWSGANSAGAAWNAFFCSVGDFGARTARRAPFQPRRVRYPLLIGLTAASLCAFRERAGWSRSYGGTNTVYALAAAQR